MNLRRILSATLACAALVPSLVMGQEMASAQDQLKLDMVRDLDLIRAIMNVEYAPINWKRDHVDWRLDEEIARAKKTVENTDNVTVKQYQRILKGVFNAMQDWHVGVSFHATESASLPLGVRGAEGKFFITYIDTKKLGPYSFPYSPGDELVEFGGRPVGEVVEELKKQEIGPGETPTEQGIAEICLTRRSAARGHVVPTGSVMVKIRPKGSDRVYAHQLIWDYTPELIADWNPTEKAPSQNPLLKPMVSSLPQFLMNKDAVDNPSSVGARNSYLPKLGNVTWNTEDDNSFDAYIAETDAGQKLGVIRIPHYSADEWEVEEFADIIERMQRSTDMLVIDQLNNPGGSVFYLYTLVSMLTDQPLRVPLHHITITPEMVAWAMMILPELEAVQSEDDAVAVMGDNLGGFPVSYALVRQVISYFRLIVSEWEAGHALTKPHPLFGVDQINPSVDVRYTKPILVLVNELDFSGGDFFPAILQDNGRITVMGTRTAGAGGVVYNYNYPNRMGVASFTLTGSLAKRIDDQPIENLGVHPDVAYKITQNDLQHDFVDYKAAILNQVELMLSK